MLSITVNWPMGLVTSITGFVFAEKTEEEGRVPISKVRARGSQPGRSQMQLGEGSEVAAREGANRRCVVREEVKQLSWYSCWMMCQLLSPASADCSYVTLHSQLLLSPLSFFFLFLVAKGRTE